jgi:hypothetical protein
MLTVRSAVVTSLLVFVTTLPRPVVGEVSDRFGTPLRVEQQANRLVVFRDVNAIATYVFRDPEILRPYFANVLVPSNLPITRRHPPRAGIDSVDHATMHPGIWLAFGDVNGHDFWRNKGRVEHLEFVEAPTAELEDNVGVVTFAVKNRYLVANNVVCTEIARHMIRAERDGYLFMFDSEFAGEQTIAFGDQEEMGLGVRVAEGITVRSGTGRIENSNTAKNEKEVWGKQADWCDYSGVLTTKVQPGNAEWKLRAGLLLVPHSQNFGRSWMHARDYGVLVANPFGQRAFTKGNPSRIEVLPGQVLRLRFGVWAYAANLDQSVNLARMASEYERLASPAASRRLIQPTIQGKETTDRR